MNDKVNNIVIFDMTVAIEDGRLAEDLIPTEGFRILFPEEEIMGRVLREHTKSLMKELVRFIITRSGIVSGDEDILGYAAQIPEITIPVMLDSENRCVLETSGIEEMFTLMRENCSDSIKERFDIFADFVMFQIADIEKELSESINSLWNMKEKGINIDVLQIE